jgi:hypothetical protein
LAPWTARFGNKKVLFSIPPRYSKQDVFFLKELSRLAGTGSSSTGATHSRMSLRRPGTSNRSGRPEMSS